MDTSQVVNHFSLYEIIKRKVIDITCAMSSGQYHYSIIFFHTSIKRTASVLILNIIVYTYIYMKDYFLEVVIQNNPQFFSLYADGREDTIIHNHVSSILIYPPDAVIFLYYTFPAHRRVYCIRNNAGDHTSELPGLSHSVKVIFKQFASRVDKTKKAVSYLREHFSQYAYSLDDGFYYRLDVLLQKKGKLDYNELDALCKRKLKNGYIINA